MTATNATAATTSATSSSVQCYHWPLLLSFN